ncbi:MAG: autotransporter-associated beta strand repeat-containing protein [Pirellulales bacterium]|nr:autotransporter-associated beta strand repeat-containing protein [Pirellulales bacterium]
MRLFLLSALLVWATPLLAASVYWTDTEDNVPPGSSDFNDGTNWDTGDVPAASDSVWIQNDHAAWITADVPNTIGNLYLGANAEPGTGSGSINHAAGTLNLNYWLHVGRYNGTNTYSMSGTSQLNQVQPTACDFRIGDSCTGTLEMTDDAQINTSNASTYVGIITSGKSETANGTMTMEDDAAFSGTGNFFVGAGYNYGATGVLGTLEMSVNSSITLNKYNNLQGGSFVVGRYSATGQMTMTGNSVLNLKNGKFYVSQAGGTGELTIGTGEDSPTLILNQGFSVGQTGNAANPSSGTLTLNSGTIIHNSGMAEPIAIANSASGTGTFTINGGSVLHNSSTTIGWNAKSLSTGTLNLNGGTYQTTYIKADCDSAGSSIATVNFNGGVLQAKCNRSDFVYRAKTTVDLKLNVLEDGAKIDTNGYWVTLNEPLVAPLTGVSGGLTKLGSGVLRTTAANTYTGSTVVQEGALIVTSTGSLASSGIEVQAKGVLGGIAYSYAPLPAVSVLAGGTVAPGDFDPTYLAGDLNIGNLTLANGAVLAFVSDYYGTAGAVAVNGNVVPTGTTTVALDTTQLISFPSSPITLLTYTGTATGLTVLPLVDGVIAPDVVTYLPSLHDPGIQHNPGSKNVTATLVSLSESNQWKGVSGADYNTAANWVINPSSTPLPGYVPNSTDQRAYFAGQSYGDVNLSGDVTVSSLTFNNYSMYTIKTNPGDPKGITLDSTIAANGQILDMAGNHEIQVEVTLAKNAFVQVCGEYDTLTLSGKVTGVGGLTTVGPGTLVLSNPDNDYDGPTVMKGGVLEVQDRATVASEAPDFSIGDGELVLNGTFRYAGVKNIVTARGFTVKGNNPAEDELSTIESDADLTFAGPIKSEGLSSFNKKGAGTLTLTNPGYNTLTHADLHVQQGKMVLNGGAASVYKMEPDASDGQSSWLVVGDESNYDATLEITSGKLGVDGNLYVGMNVTAGTTSTLKMTGGKLEVNAISLGEGDGSNGYSVVELSGDAEIMAHTNGRFGNHSPMYGCVNDATLTMSGHSKLEFNGTVKFGNLAGSSATVTLSGDSLFSLNPAASSAVYAYFGQNGTCDFTLQGNARFSTAPGVEVTFGQGSTGRSVANIEGGTLEVSDLFIGKAEDAAGAVYQSGGSIKCVSTNSNTTTSNAQNTVGAWHIGGAVTSTPTASTAYGYYSLSNGTAESYIYDPVYIGGSYIGVVDQTGGTFLPGQAVVLGNDAGSYGVYNLTGGTAVLSSTGSTKQVGKGGSGVLTVAGTGQYRDAYRTIIGNVAGSSGVVNLGAMDTGGGLLATQYIYPGSGAAELNFHGGTLQAVANQSDFMRLDATVYDEGATVDTNGFDVTISKNLLAPPAGNGIQSVTVPAGQGGEGYLGPPVVLFSDTLGVGTGATGYAKVVDGEVAEIVVTNPGTGYTDGYVMVSLIGGGPTTPADYYSFPVATNTGNASGGLTKVGVGTLTLSGTNTYSGPTEITGGAVSIDAITAGGTPGPLGASPAAASNLVFTNGAKLAYTGATEGTTDRGMTLGAGGGAVETANPLTFTGQVVGADGGGLTKDGAGMLTLSGTIDYSGDTAINAGRLQVNSASATVGVVYGDGDLGVGDGTVSASLTASSISVNSLSIGVPPPSGAPAASSQGVPEPSTMLLLALAGLGVFLAARRRK